MCSQWGEGGIGAAFRAESADVKFIYYAKTAANNEMWRIA